MTNGQDYRITSARPDEAEEIAAFARVCFGETFAHMNYPPEDLASHYATALSRERYAGVIADPAYDLRLARDAAGALGGYILIGPNVLPLPEGEPPVEATRELHQLYLASDAQGSGLAQRLMAFVAEDAARHQPAAVYLSVWAGNIRAQRFYARHGFAEAGKMVFMVGNTADDEQLWKWVP